MLSAGLLRNSFKGAASAAPFFPILLDQMPNAIVVFEAESQHLIYVNPAAESAFDLSRKSLVGQSLHDLFGDNLPLSLMIEKVKEGHFTAQRQEIILHSLPGSIHQDSISAHVVVAILDDPALIMMEWFPIDQQLRGERDERVTQQVEANKQLMRNLAHEIKNPLGGIRGAAQLLEYELPDKGLREYTQVIIKESDRLQNLVDRLLAPHRKAHAMEYFNVHEALERVRSLVLAEFPKGLRIVRNYDTSLPDLLGDREQLIQAMLNIAHNAAQALSEEISQGLAQIELRTRVARSVTISRKHYKLAIDLHVIDNGPGISDEIRERIFFPLVSGREGGSGLGLTLAQTFVQQHQGFIACESHPGRTDFHIQIPYRIQEKAS
jgi:two-component system nitrogen regulation sensor histidine kinase GlnL